LAVRERVPAVENVGDSVATPELTVALPSEFDPL
jgi:hypothetical protein